jgi:hypothetical protein
MMPTLLCSLTSSSVLGAVEKRTIEKRQREVATNSFSTKNELSRELSRSEMVRQRKKHNEINGLVPGQ